MSVKPTSCVATPPGVTKNEQGNCESRENLLQRARRIRGLGIVLVLISHFRLIYLAEMIPQARWEMLWVEMADFNWVAMEWFFAMSGFLITGILLRTRRHEAHFKNFYMRRFFRIVPLY